jgi:hypothetical protein
VDVSRFDQMTRHLGARVSRRTALGAGLAGLGLSLGNRVSAQQATPATLAGEGDEPVFLFVQTAVSGRGELNPAAGTPEVDGTPVPAGGASLLVTLEGHSGQTIYFSDRPDRIVGATPTEQFLDTLGFSPTNPPNAALVAEFQAGQGVVVLELIQPTYDPDTGTLTYGAEVLEGYEGENLTPVLTDQVAERLPAEFGASALFIDGYDPDCPDITSCYRSAYGGGQEVNLGPIPGGPYAVCYSWSTGDCLPCDYTWRYLDELCNSSYPECSDNCVAW